MKLADNKEKLMEKVRTATRGSKSVTMSDLSISDALNLVNGQSLKERGGCGGNSSDRYDKIEEKLIDKLEKMQAAEAEAAAQETINKITKIVSTKKAEKWKPKLAA
jgi:hypothetical protein